jgi:hypothetical protein
MSFGSGTLTRFMEIPLQHWPSFDGECEVRQLDEWSAAVHFAQRAASRGRVRRSPSVVFDTCLSAH